MKPFKYKSDFIFLNDSVKIHFVCDPEKNTECTKENCGKECTMTSNIKFAKRFELND